MAQRNIAKSGQPDARRIVLLPFEADLRDAANPKRVNHVWWNIPDDADYCEACTIGRRWGAQFIAYSRTHDLPTLSWIVRDIAKRESQLSPQSGSTGFRVGFLDAIKALACIGGQAAGGAHKWLAGVEDFYREEELEREVERRAQGAVRVARMNAARAAKAKARKCPS